MVGIDLDQSEFEDLIKQLVCEEQNGDQRDISV